MFVGSQSLAGGPVSGSLLRERKMTLTAKALQLLGSFPTAKAAASSGYAASRRLHINAAERGLSVNRSNDVSASAQHNRQLEVHP